MLRVILLSVLVACGGGAPRPVASPEARAVNAKAWSKRDASLPLVPGSAKRVEIVLTRGWSKGAHLVWIVSDGTRLVAVYRAEAAELSDVMAKLGEVVRPRVGSPLAVFSNGAQGIIAGPPPPPPDGPSGIPGRVVNAVIDYTSHLDQQSQQLDRELRGEQ